VCHLRPQQDGETVRAAAWLHSPGDNLSWEETVIRKFLAQLDKPRRRWRSKRWRAKTEDVTKRFGDVIAVTSSISM
jgi:hypothetical protein